eukprot:COSAG01_NODE_21045_length_921_cov_0.751825_1_plen_113_part_10
MCPCPKRTAFHPTNTHGGGCHEQDPFGGGDVVRGNLIFNHVRETTDHGNVNIWDRGPYISDIGYVRDDDATPRSLKPTALELMAGATPGFRLQSGSGKGAVSNGSATGQYRRF